MKKLISLAVSLLIIVNQAAFCANAFEQSKNSMTANDFYSLMREMLCEYDSAAVQTFAGSESGEFETCRLIVKSAKSIDTLSAVSVISGYRDLWILQFENAVETQEAFGYYSTLDCVEYVEPDARVELFETQTYSNGRLSWGSDAVGSDEVLDFITQLRPTLPEIKIAVLDSGIDYNHSFLKDRMTDTGINLSVSGDNTGMSDDASSHGTHIAGIIADNTPDNVKIKSYKIFSSSGVTTNTAIFSAVDKAVEDGMDIINASFGGGVSQTVIDSFANAHKAGVVIVAATGNKGVSLADVVPACLDEAIAVASINSRLEYQTYSNYGSAVDLLAPGENVYSTVNGDAYDYMSGTSMATPFVTACAAILLSLEPSLTPEEVENRLKSTAYSIGISENFGGCGIVNIADAVNPERADAPAADKESGVYTSSVTVTLAADKDVAVYYSFDEYPDDENGILYTDSIDISESCTLRWATYSDDGKFRSETKEIRIDICPAEAESEFEVDENGVITAYNGDSISLTVPQKIGGVSVTAVGEGVFSYENHPNLEQIILPASVAAINAKAFYQNTSIRSVTAEGVETVGNQAFYCCSSLTKADFPGLTQADMHAFSGCTALYDISLAKLETLGNYAFSGNRGLNEISLPALTSIGTNAFENSAVKSAEFASLKTFKAGNESYSSCAFKSCSLLEKLSFPEMTSTGSFRNYLDGFYNLPSLTEFSAPKLIQLEAKAFYSCVRLKNTVLDSVESVGDGAFQKCESLEELSLPKAEYIGASVFTDSGVTRLYLPSLKELHSVPVKDAEMFIPSTATVLDGSSSYATITVYGFSGSYAQTWAKSEHSGFKTEFKPLPLIVEDVPYVITDSAESVETEALGFNLSYQWYGSSDGSNKNGTPISGETSAALILSTAPEYRAYYCVITDTDGTTSATAVTSPASKNPALADYTAYNSAVASAPEDLSIYTDSSAAALMQALNTDVSGKFWFEQSTVDAQTKAILDAISLLEIKPADKTQLNEALARVPADLSLYTAESAKAVSDLVAQINSLQNPQQETVDELTSELNKALNGLKLRNADYSSVEAAIAAIPSDLSVYTDKSVSALQDAVDSVEYGLDITKQKKVDGFAEEIREKTDSLKKLSWFTLFFRAIGNFFKNLFG